MKPNFDVFGASLTSLIPVAFAGALGSVLVASPALSGQTGMNRSISPNVFQTQFTSEMPHEADSFVDLLGLNVHLHYTKSPYATNYSGIKSLLLGLGARHIRDGVLDTTWQPFYDRLNDLGNSGVKSTLTTDRSQTASLLTAYPRRVAASLEAYEAPNEQDQTYASDPQWPQKAQAFQRMLFTTVHGNAATQNLRVVGPSIGGATNSLLVGNLTQYMDAGNFHEYWPGFNPGTPGWGSLSVYGWYGSMDCNINIAKIMAGSRRLQVTETGYNTGSNVRGNVPLDIQGRYSPRILLEMFNRGVQRSFVYELIDNTTTPSTASSFQMGLASASLQPKPSYRAIANLNALLVDRGASFAPTALSYAVSGNLNNVHHALFQKRDKSYYLAVWIEQPGWAPANSQSGGGKYLNVPPQTVTVSLARAARALLVTNWHSDGTVATTSKGSSAVVALSVTDTISVLHIIP